MYHLKDTEGDHRPGPALDKDGLCRYFWYQASDQGTEGLPGFISRTVCIQQALGNLCIYTVVFLMISTVKVSSALFLCFFFLGELFSELAASQ